MAAILRQIRRWLSVGFVGIVTGVGSLIAAGDSATSRAGPQRASRPATQASGEEHFNSIFNGRDLDDWVYGTADNAMKQGAGYQVDRVAGVVHCTVKDVGNLYTKKEYANFVLQFEFKLTKRVIGARSAEISSD